MQSLKGPMTHEYYLNTSKNRIKRIVEGYDYQDEKYYALVDKTQQRDINEGSKTWEQMGFCVPGNDYYVLEQLNSNGKLTGYIRCIHKSHAKINRSIIPYPSKEVLAEKSEYWMYFKKIRNCSEPPTNA